MTKYQPSYKICLRVLRGQNILQASTDNKLNPFVVFQLQGSDEVIQTPVLKNTTNPVFNSFLTLNGYFVGSDQLNVYIKNKSEGSEEDEVVGFATVYACTFNLGEVQNYTLNLYKYDKKKNSIDKKSAVGSAGQLFLQVHIAQSNDTPFEDNAWNYPLYNACLDIIDAKNCPVISDGSADPMVSVMISPSLNTQLKNTQVQHSLEPVWNKSFEILLDNYQKQTIEISMQSKNKKEKIPMGNYKLSLADCAVGRVYDKSVELSSVNGQPPATLHYRLQIIAKDSVPFNFIRDRVNYEEEESVVSKQSVTSIRSSQESMNVAERSVEISQDESAENRKSIRLSSSPKTRLLKNSNVDLEAPDAPTGISESECILHINLIQATLQKEYNSLVKFYVRSPYEETSFKSKTIEKSNNPKWNQKFDLNSKAILSDVVVVDMYKDSPLPENQLMDTIELPIRNLPYGSIYTFNKDVKSKNQVAGHLNFTINIENLNNEHCHFQWGQMGSSYSTSFTGYSQKGRSISAHSSDEHNTYHVHEEIIKEVRKPKKIENIEVYITGYHNIPFESETTKACAIIQRKTKFAEKGRPKKLNDIQDPNSKIAKGAKFEKVKPGNIIEILLYQYPKADSTHKHLVCGLRLRVKDMNFDSKPREFDLLSPEQLNDENAPKTDVGKLIIAARHEVQFK